MTRTDTTADGSRAVLPAPGASVAVVGSALTGTTDEDGRFHIEGVPPGQRTLRVRLSSYRTADRTVRVVPGDTARLDILLQPQAQRLAAVRASALPADVEMFVARPSVATIALTAEAMSGIPRVGEADVARVVQLLPGIVARNDYNTGLNVRGGETDQNLILLDGFAIYNPFHFGAVFSTFMDATVGGFELLTGAFPARYGGRLSSVLDVRSAEPVRAGLHGSADFSVLGATGRLADTFGSGRGTWSFAARRTYADAATEIFTENIFPYHFRDLHARATYDLRGDTRLALTGYAGRDVLDANLAAFDTDSTPTRAGGGRWAFDWGNRLVGIALTREFAPSSGGLASQGATLEQRLSASGFSTLLDLGDGTYSQRSSIRDLRAAGTLTARGAAHDISLGYDLAEHRIRYASGSAQTGTTEFDFVQRPLAAAAWIADLWRLSPRWLLETGLRAEWLDSREWRSLSPRMSMKYFATEELAFTAAAGRVTQFLHSLAGDGPMRYFEIWLASDSFAPVATAWHSVLGAERRYGGAGSLKLEGFVKRYDRLLEANWSEDPQRRGDEFFPARGLSYGLDMLGRWNPRPGLAGWLSYTYGVSYRERQSADGTVESRWYPGHDRRHDVDLVARWTLNRYQLGARFGFATGTPYTPIIGEIARRVYDPSRDHWGTGEPRIYIESLGGARNSARFPATHRLDVDVSRDFRWGRSTISPYLSVVNAYNAKNVFVYLYEYSTDSPKRRAISQFPILPSLGVRVEF